MCQVGPPFGPRTVFDDIVLSDITRLLLARLEPDCLCPDYDGQRPR